MPASRRSAAEIAADLKRLQEASVDDRDRQSLLHELSVHQEELLVQNESLQRAWVALEESRDRFIELYDFAPNGYVTLDEHGIIQQCNLTAAALLGSRKETLHGLPLIGFVMLADRSKYIELLRRCRVLVSAGAECEVTMRTIQGPRIFQLLVRAHRAQTSDGESQREFFTSLVDVTDQRALAQERARVADEYAALATRFIEVQDAERQRIARNLHDDIGQQHTAIWLKLELLLRQTTEEPVKRLIEEIRHMFARLDQRVHFVATELRPSSLDLGLVRALEQFVHEWSATFRVPVSFLSHLPTHVRFAVEVETQLYRIAQEALNNVAKHASARNVSVVIDVREHEVVLVVEDDGRGFDSRNAAIARQSFGLVGMRERAQLVGGRLSVESAPGHGTSIFVHVPNPAMPGSQSERGSR